MRRWAWIVAAGVLAASGCGDEPRLGSRAAEELHAGVEEVRAAAGNGDRDGALRALDSLAERVRAEASLSDEEAAALQRGIRRAKRSVEREVAAPQPTPEPTPEPTAQPEPEEEPSGNGKNRDKDKDKDKHGDDDEGDD